MARNTSLALLGLFALTSCADHNGSNVTGTGPLFQNLPAFQTRIDVGTGIPSHADGALADFDGDGQLDMVVLSLNGDLQFLKGNGNGTFDDVPALNVGGAPLGLRAADLDGDADQDLVILRTGASAVDIYFNDGLGNFTAGSSLPTGDVALFHVLADVDGDGNTDVVVSRQISPELRVFMGDGAGNFTNAPPLSLPAGGRPLAMAVGEATGDSLADLVVADPRNDRVLVYAGVAVNGPLATVPEEIAISGSPNAVSIGDLSGDGVNDIAVSQSAADQVFVVTGRSSITVNGFAVPVSGSPSLSTIADLDGDGIQDLALAVLGRNSVSVFSGDGLGGLADERQYDAAGLPLRPLLGDVNQDGRTDLLYVSGQGDRVNLFLGADDGLLGAQSFDAGINSAETVSGADFDGDGTIEAVVGGPADTKVSFLRSAIDPATGRERLVSVHQIDLGVAIYNVEAADLDKDGSIDVAVALQGGVVLLANRSTPGNFAFDRVPGSGVLLSGVGPYSMALADMDADGNCDLVVADFQGDEVSVAMSDGTDFGFDSPQRLAVSGKPAGLVVGDFTGDGITDVAVSRQGLAVVSVLENDGQGNLQSSLDYPVGAGPTFLRSADFNNDGREDLVVSNGSGNSLTVLFSLASGVSARDYPAGDTPSALLAEDINNDGFDDLLVTSLVGGDFQILLGDGDGGFPVVRTFPGTALASAAALLDMDGDGNRDLMVASLRTTRLSYIRNITP